MVVNRDPLVDRLAALGVVERGEPMSPPVALAPSVLAAALAVRPSTIPPAEPGTPAGLLVEVSDALDADLETLDAHDWSRPVVAGWSVQDMVAHLAAVHEVLVQRLHGRDDRPVTPTELDLATERVIAEQRRFEPSVTRALWRASVDRLRHGLAVSDTQINWLGLAVGAEATIVDRAFETWIHGNDIRRVTNRSSLDPSGQHLEVLCDLAVEILPLTLVAAERPVDALVTLNLSGSGGGTWLMPLGVGAASGIEFTVKAVARELCLLLGDRIDAADFAYTVRGHDNAAAIMGEVVQLAPSFARP